MLIKLIVKSAANSIAIYSASSLIEGFTFSGDLFILIGIGIALAVFQSFIYPIIKILAFPLVLLSFGLFGSIVNVIMLWGMAYFLPELTIDGLMPLLLGAVALSIANLLLSWL